MNVFYGLTIVLLLAAGCTSRSTAPPPTAAATSRPEASPDEVAREFWVGYLEQDREAILRTSVPNPDLHLLWSRAAPIPPAMLAGMIESAERCPIRVLKPGEEFTYLDRRTRMNEYSPIDYQPLLMEWSIEPEFFAMHRINGTWRVDAGGHIAAQKAIARVKAGR